MPLDGRQAAQAPDQAPTLAQRGHRQERLRAVLKARRRLRAPALQGFQLPKSPASQQGIGFMKKAPALFGNTALEFSVLAPSFHAKAPVQAKQEGLGCVLTPGRAPEEVGVGGAGGRGAAAKVARAQARERVAPRDQRAQAGRVAENLVVRQRLRANEHAITSPSKNLKCTS